MTTILIRWVLGALLSAGALAGAYLWITTAAFNRGHAAGVAETTEQMKRAIAKQAAETAKDIERLKTLPRDELQKELEKKCREAGGGDACAQ